MKSTLNILFLFRTSENESGIVFKNKYWNIHQYKMINEELLVTWSEERPLSGKKSILWFLIFYVDSNLLFKMV